MLVAVIVLEVVVDDIANFVRGISSKISVKTCVLAYVDRLFSLGQFSI